MSIMTFALGLLVLKEQIFLSEGTLQTVTPTLGRITEENTDRGAECSKCMVQTFSLSRIINGGRWECTDIKPRTVQTSW